MLAQRTLDLVDSQECESTVRGDLAACAGILAGSHWPVFQPAQPIGASRLQAAPRVVALQPAVKQICRSITNTSESDLFGLARVGAIRSGGG